MSKPFTLPHQDRSVSQPGAPGVVEIRDLSSLKPNPLNPRGPLSAEDPAIRELAVSIRTQGLLEPLVILPDGTIVAGHRRHIACGLAKVTRVRVIVQPMSEADQLEAMLAENVQRQDLDPLQEAMGYQKLKDLDVGTSDIARRTGVPTTRVSARLKILALPSDVQHMFKSLQLPVSAADPLSQITGEEDLRRAAGMVVSRRLTIPALQEFIKKEFGPKKKQINRANTHNKPADRPKGVVRDLLVHSLTAISDRSLTVRDLLREMDYICCACGMADSPGGQATLCAACPLASFLNRFAQIEVSKVTKRNDLLAETAPAA